jgi:chemotaxis protein MotB
MMTACVSHKTHSRALGELNEARQANAESRQELDAYKKEATAAAGASDAERGKLMDELGNARAGLGSLQSKLDDLQRESDERTAALRKENSRLGQAKSTADRRSGSLEIDRQVAQERIKTLEKESDDMRARVESLTKEREALQSAAAEAARREEDLQGRVASLTSQVASLQNENRNLFSGTTTAQHVIAQLRQRAGELESASARAEDLAKQLSDRDQNLARQKQNLADYERELTALRAVAAEKEKLMQQLAASTDEVTRLGQEGEQLKQDSTRLADEHRNLQAKLRQEADRLKAAEAERDTLAIQFSALTTELTGVNQERDALKERQNQLAREHEELLAKLQQDADRLKAEEAEKDRLKNERLAKEEEMKRLTAAQAQLTASLKDEINKGTVTIQQVRDRLTINMVEKVLFDSGRAQIKPDGMKVLQQVGDVLKDVSDKQIRIEGHTDNVRIGTKLRDKFETNWELSTARATNVVRYLIDEGGVEPGHISAAGYADTRPVATNDSPDGKSSNRRIEIILYPRDLAEIAQGLTADAR